MWSRSCVVIACHSSSAVRSGRRANARNVSFCNRYGGQIYHFNFVDISKLSLQRRPFASHFRQRGSYLRLDYCELHPKEKISPVMGCVRHGWGLYPNLDALSQKISARHHPETEKKRITNCSLKATWIWDWPARILGVLDEWKDKTVDDKGYIKSSCQYKGFSETFDVGGQKVGIIGEPD